LVQITFPHELYVKPEPTVPAPPAKSFGYGSTAVIGSLCASFFLSCADTSWGENEYDDVNACRLSRAILLIYQLSICSVSLTLCFAWAFTRRIISQIYPTCYPIKADLWLSAAVTGAPQNEIWTDEEVGTVGGAVRKVYCWTHAKTNGTRTDISVQR